MSGEEQLRPEWVIERQGRKMVLYAGLLHLAHLNGLECITTTVVQAPSDLNGQTCIVHATVQTKQGTFSGIGDTTPKNVGRMVADHAIRMAETRAKARALRDALDIGYVAAEELGDDGPAPTPRETPNRGPWPRKDSAPSTPAETPPTRPVVDDSAPLDLPAVREEYARLRAVYLGRGGTAKELPAGASLVVAIGWLTALRERMDREAGRA
jgi:hypothetical protein